MNEPAATQPKEFSCEECRELLSDYIDRELSASEQAAVEAHVASCTKCGTESSRLLGLKKLVQHWDGVPGSGEFRKATLEKFVTESQMLAAQPFRDAAASARGAPEDKRAGLPVGWVLGGALALAALAYVLIKFLRGC